MPILKKLALSATSVMALGVMATYHASSSMAADAPMLCDSGFAGTVGAGYNFGKTDIDFISTDFSNTDNDDYSLDLDYGTFFGEAAALYKFCESGINIQGDFAFHSHQMDADDIFGSHGGSDDELGNDRWHAGGVMFWRDEDVGLVGLDGSFINNDLNGYNFDSWRIGLRGEYFLGEMFTIGAGAGYNDGDTYGENWNGFDVNAWGRLYLMDNFGLLARFDWSDFEGDYDKLSTSALTGEGEFKLPDHPLSLFLGVRYAEQELDDDWREITADHLQVYGGLKVYFGSNDASLAAHHRSNTLDNSSVSLEKLPSINIVERRKRLF